jgi:Helix-turn-helix domain
MRTERHNGLALVAPQQPCGPAAPEAAEVSFTLPPGLLDALADRLAPRVAALLQETTDVDQWLDSGQAADYLAMTRNALHKLTSAREIPFEQEAPGCKLYLKRSELDRWRQGGRAPK